jgi:hypothetical protein
MARSPRLISGADRRRCLLTHCRRSNREASPTGTTSAISTDSASSSLLQRGGHAVTPGLRCRISIAGRHLSRWDLAGRADKSARSRSAAAPRPTPNLLRDYFGTFRWFLRECFRPVPSRGAGLAPSWGGKYLSIQLHGWCRMQDSNPRPSVYKTAALPAELIRRVDFAAIFGFQRSAFYNPTCRFTNAPRICSSLAGPASPPQPLRR